MQPQFKDPDFTENSIVSRTCSAVRTPYPFVVMGKATRAHLRSGGAGHLWQNASAREPRSGSEPSAKGGCRLAHVGCCVPRDGALGKGHKMKRPLHSVVSQKKHLKETKMSAVEHNEAS